jgi:phosphoribosylamine--glycine ligase
MPETMNILIIGSGGREHAIAWRIGQSSRADRVFVAPGNAGTATDAENVDIRPHDIPNLIRFAKDNDVRITVVGPEAPLAAGIVDAFHEEGLRIFGPSQAAAQLESSKLFCKTLMHHADVPTADFRVFEDARRAERFVTDRFPRETEDVPLVVKADGLAAGKGVFVCRHQRDALDAIARIAVDREFGAAGDRIIIEERLDGEEASVLAITDGRTLLVLPSAQDHKAALDGDKGPNTGGMGAYCPTPLLDEATLRTIEQRILVPTVHAMKRGRTPFLGVLYAGLMVTNQGPKVLEFNVRFGDPECEAILMRLQSDLLDIVEATIDGALDQLTDMRWDPRPAITVVMASEGYPDQVEVGRPIRGLDNAAQIEDVKVFHAGTASLDDQTITNGGRVLAVTAMGNSISSAKLQAYRAVKCIRWDGAWCRKDISDRALKYQ